MESIKFRVAAFLGLMMCCAAALAGVAPSQSPGMPLTAEDVNAWLDGHVPYALKRGDIAGAVIVVVKDGQILTERGFGYADVARRKLVDPQLTLFRPGSVSKLLTWTAVMQLVEAGKLNLDADINQYLDFKIPPREGGPITLRNLLQHTAGFEEYGEDVLVTDAKRAVTPEAWIKQWIPKRIFAAGSTPAYSNYGAALAGYIIQRVSGETFDSYIERHLFAPLDMRHSTFRQRLPENLAPLMSQGYNVASEDSIGFEYIGPTPAGGLSSTGDDMAHFMIAHLQRGEFNGNPILRPETVVAMHDSPLTLLPPLNRMELGFFETNINDREVIGHLGDTQAFHSGLYLFLNESVGFYICFNSAGKDDATGRLLDALFEDFADRYFPAPRNDGRVTAAIDARHAAMMSGHWLGSRRPESNFLFALAFAGQKKLGVGLKGELTSPFQGPNGQPIHWEEIAPFVWRDADGHQRLAAKVVAGEVVRWSIDGVSPFQVYERIPWYQSIAWLGPLFWASVAALAITVVLWPIAAITRYRYGAPLRLAPRALLGLRMSRIAATVILAALAAWTWVLATVLTDIKYGHSFAPIVLLTEIFGICAFPGGLLLMLWSSRLTWQTQRHWTAKAWSVLLVVAALAVLWVAVVFKLISLGVWY